MLKKHVWLGLFVVVALIPCLESADYYVPDDFPSIQDAIDSAGSGDVIIVKPGIYVENIDFKGKAITVMSQKGPEYTAIKSRGICPDHSPVVTLDSGEGRDSVLSGFTIQDGRAYNGSGIYCGVACSPTIIGNIIKNNYTDCCSIPGPGSYGGGVYCGVSSSPLIMNNVIKLNRACSVWTWGGWTEGHGGGIFIDSNSTAVLINNLIYHNLTLTEHPDGGGVYISSASPTLTNNTIFNNNLGEVTPPLDGDIETGRNYAGAEIYVTGSSLPVVTNNIIWNSRGRDTISGPMDVNFCNVSESCPGVGNISIDPGFIQDYNADLHITCDSPCRDAGYNEAPGLEEIDLDFEGDPRIANGQIDIGADEFGSHLYYVRGSYHTIRVTGLPGMSPVYVIQGSGVRNPPLSTPYGDLYIRDPALHIYDFGAITSKGTLVVPFRKPSFFQSGAEYYYQALIGPRDHQDSVLTNLLLLIP